MKRNRCLTNEEEARLRRVLSRRADVMSRRDYAWFRLLLSTGLRITEFSLLTVGDARAALRTGHLFIPRELRKKKTVDLTAHVRGEAKEAMTDLLTICAEMADIPPARLPDEHPLVLSRKHCAMTARAYQQRMKLWAKEAGVDAGISPHWLRHTFAVTFAEHSEASTPVATLVRLKNLLGHSDGSSCMHYLSMSREDVGAEIERIFPSRKRVRGAALRRAYERWSAA